VQRRIRCARPFSPASRLRAARCARNSNFRRRCLATAPASTCAGLMVSVNATPALQFERRFARIAADRSAPRRRLCARVYVCGAGAPAVARARWRGRERRRHRALAASVWRRAQHHEQRHVAGRRCAGDDDDCGDDETTAATTETTTRRDGRLDDDDGRRRVAHRATRPRPRRVRPSASVEAPPPTTTSIRIEVDDAHVRFKALKVQVASTATTVSATTAGSDRFARAIDRRRTLWSGI
jgi:hypothetical protein